MSLGTYIKETKAELAHVSWPTKSQTVAFTIVVIAAAVVTAGLLGLFDGLYAWLLEKLISFGRF